MILTRLEATKKVKELKEKKNVDDLAKEIGIAKMTLYTRLEKMNWKKPELVAISYM